MNFDDLQPRVIPGPSLCHGECRAGLAWVVKGTVLLWKSPNNGHHAEQLDVCLSRYDMLGDS